jgi:Flp pilus assembly protein TadB
MMGFFRKKKEKKEESGDFIEQHRRLQMPPTGARPSIVSREFKIFKRKEKKRLTWFEILARLSGKILKANPDENTRKEMESAISFTGLRVTPQDVMGLVVLDLIIFVGVAVVLAISGLMPLVGSMFIAALGIGLAYYFLRYPVNLLKSYRIRASSQVVLAVLYMVVSMRISPNLENALRFASANISGPLAWDMRRLIWDIEMKKYYSASHALTDYIAKWKSENEEFAESLRLIRDSLTHPSGRSEAILNEALEVILEGTKTRMKHYAQELSMPVTIIHMMGIILPVMGSIMAPLAAVFLAEMVRPEYFVIGYDIVLPLFLIWFINSILRTSLRGGISLSRGGIRS